MIVYPSTIKTDQEKLFALYRLSELYRREHNDVMPKLSGDLGKKAQYFKLFKSLYLPVLRERSRIKDVIQKANFSDAEWATISDDDKMVAIPNLLFGNRQEVIQTTTGAAESPSFEQLKAVDITKLVGKDDDPTEDFTSANWNSGSAQSDPNTRLAIIAAKVTTTACQRDENVYFYRTMTISGDYEYLLESRHTGNVGSGQYYFVTGANYVGTALDYTEPNAACGLLWYSTGTIYIQAWTTGVTQDGTSGTSGSTDYWITWDRVSTTHTCYIFSDSSRETAVGDVTATRAGTGVNWTNLYAGQSYNSGHTSALSCWMQDLDLQEAVAGVVPQAFMHMQRMRREG